MLLHGQVAVGLTGELSDAAIGERHVASGALVVAEPQVTLVRIGRRIRDWGIDILPTGRRSARRGHVDGSVVSVGSRRKLAERVAVRIVSELRRARASPESLSVDV